MLKTMGKPGEEQSYPDLMTHLQILQRFKKLFGREMTPKERNIFFLPDAAKLAEEAT